MSAPRAVKRGDRFEHAHQIDGSPRAGTAWPVVMEVTRIGLAGTVYYRRADTTGRATWRATPSQLGDVVGRWLDGMPDAPDVWDDTAAPGGYVCSECGTPTESEPCPAHQPAARRWTAS